MATIRNDLVGSIYAAGYLLHAGNKVPPGVHVHETLLNKTPAKADGQGTTSVVEKPKRGPGRPKKAADSKPKGDTDADAS